MHCTIPSRGGLKTVDTIGEKSYSSFWLFLLGKSDSLFSHSNKINLTAFLEHFLKTNTKIPFSAIAKTLPVLLCCVTSGVFTVSGDNTSKLSLC